MDDVRDTTSTDGSLAIVMAGLTKMDPVGPEDVAQSHTLRSPSVSVYKMQNGAAESVLITLSQHHHDHHHHHHNQGWNRTHHLRMCVFDKHPTPHDDCSTAPYNRLALADHPLESPDCIDKLTMHVVSKRQPVPVETGLQQPSTPLLVVQEARE